MDESQQKLDSAGVFFTDRIYYVSSPEDDTVLIAMDVRLEKGYLHWFDTIKERVMPVAHIDRTQDGILVTTPGGHGDVRIYSFTPLTLEIYETRVRPELLSPQDFQDIEALYRAFESTRESAW